MAITTVNDDSFAKEVLQASVPVIVEFSKPGTNEFNEPDHSTRMKDILDSLAADYGDKVKIARVALDTNPKAAELCGVTAVPTLLLIQRVPDFHLKFWIKKKIDAMLE